MTDGQIDNDSILINFYRNTIFSEYWKAHYDLKTLYRALVLESINPKCNSIFGIIDTTTIPDHSSVIVADLLLESLPV